MEIKNFKMETIKKSVKEKFEKGKKKAKNMAQVIEKNPDIGARLAACVGTSIIGLLYMVKNAADRREAECRVDDIFLGCEWKTTHPLDNDELMELTRRLYEENQSKGQALSEMQVLR